MKRFLKNSILFLILFFIIEKGTYYFLYKSPEREYDKRLENIINGKVNKDLIVLGSSRGSGNIIASQIEKETGLSSFNLSYQGANIIYLEFILKTLLKFNKAPSKVLLAIDNPAEFTKVSTLNFRFDRLYPLSKYNSINDELIKQNKRNSLSKLFCLARMSSSNFKMKAVEPPTLNPFESCGSRPVLRESRKDLVFLEDLNTYSIENEKLEYITAFNEIQRICQIKNIQLYFVFSPNYHVFNSKFKKRFETLMLSGNKIMVYDSLNPIYQNKDYFYDVSHLRKNGAKVFTSEISAYLNNY